MAACRLLLRLAALAALAQLVAAISFVVTPGGDLECVLETLSAEALRPGMTLPETIFLGRAAFMLRSLEAPPHLRHTHPGLFATVTGPSGTVLWQQHISPRRARPPPQRRSRSCLPPLSSLRPPSRRHSFKEDAVFAGDGLGEYKLCFQATLNPGEGARLGWWRLSVAALTPPQPPGRPTPASRSTSSTCSPTRALLTRGCWSRSRASRSSRRW